MQATVQGKLAQYYAHPAAQQARRTEGASYMIGELDREISQLDHFKKADNGGHDRNPAVGAVDLHHPGHSMAIPSRTRASWTDDQIFHEQGLFITTTDTNSTPSFKTFSEVTLTSNGMVKRAATEEPDGGVRVRTVVVDRADIAKSYTEEFFIAGGR